MVHLRIGEIYAFSVFKNPLVERFGTGLTPIGIIFSIVMLGLSAAVFGTWVERAGPRAAMFTALCWSGGFVIAALGVATTQLWLVYLGYGVLGGIGLGIGYISPISTLNKLFWAWASSPTCWSDPWIRASSWSQGRKVSTRKSLPSPAAPQESGGQTSSSMVLVVALWAFVLIPLLWGVYQTLAGVVALFTG
jgi:hypothetical protein